MGAKIPLNGTSNVNRQTHTHTYVQIDLYKASAQRADALKIPIKHYLHRYMFKDLGSYNQWYFFFFYGAEDILVKFIKVFWNFPVDLREAER